MDEPLVWYEGAGLGDRRGLLANHQGSIVGVTNASGGVLYRNTYEEYGARGGADAGRFSFTGQIAIPELGLLHYKARAYNTAIGRFLQTDPVGYEADNNLYAYVHNDPLNRADPTGTEDQDAINERLQIMQARDALPPDQQRQFNETQVKIGAAVVAVVVAAPVVAALLPEAGAAGTGGTVLTEGGEAAAGGAFRQSLMNTSSLTAPGAEAASSSGAGVSVSVPGSVNLAETTATVGSRAEAMATAAEQHSALEGVAARAGSGLEPPTAPQTPLQATVEFFRKVLGAFGPSP